MWKQRQLYLRVRIRPFHGDGKSIIHNLNVREL